MHERLTQLGILKKIAELPGTGDFWSFRLLSRSADASGLALT